MAAAADLSGFSAFPGPKKGGAVTTETLFRGNTSGDLAGPYLSQFLWQDIPFGAKTVTQQYHTTVAGVDYITNYNGRRGIKQACRQRRPWPRFRGHHWRTDGSAGIKLGEAVAIGILQNYRNTCNEDFSGFTLTKFDGTTVII